MSKKILILGDRPSKLNKSFTVEDDIAFLIKYRKDFIDKMGQ